MGLFFPNLTTLDFASFILRALVFLIILLVIFLIIRQIVLWYFKIDENTTTLRRIAEALEKIAAANDFIATNLDQSGVDASIKTMKEVDKSIGFEVKKLD